MEMPITLPLPSGTVLISGSLSHIPDYSYRLISRSQELLAYERGYKLSNFSIPSQRDLQQQFRILDEFMCHPFYAESFVNENSQLNRYSDVLTCKFYIDRQTQVPLLTGSRFINANYINVTYIKGAETPVDERLFIATQGPLPNTINDFWKMVWQEKSSSIFMLVNVNECKSVIYMQGRCEVYWPLQGERVQADNITISCVARTKYPGYIVSDLRIQMSEEEIRAVRHYLFTDWPDRGIPSDTNSFNELLTQLDIEKPVRTGPIVVHCSAGVGRTGTFIALDTLKKIIDSQKSQNVDLGVSVFSVVRRLREQRILMVQTDLQYGWLYRFVQRWLS